MKLRTGVSVLAAALGFCALASAADTRGWLGIYQEPVANLPAIEQEAGGSAMLRGATGGLRVTAIFPDSPAEQGGLLLGDIIIGIDGDPFVCRPESLGALFQHRMAVKPVGESCTLRVVRDGVTRELSRDGRGAARSDEIRFWRAPGELIDSLRSGESVEASARKQQQVVDLHILLGPRPEARWAPAPREEEIFPPGRFAQSSFTLLTWRLVDAFGLRADTEDLLARLGRCEETIDPYRLGLLTYVHRRPFEAEAAAREVSDHCLALRDPAKLLRDLGRLWLHQTHVDYPAVWGETPPQALPSSHGGRRNVRILHPPAPRVSPVERARLVEPLVAEITRVLDEATALHQRAFSSLSAEERRFLEERCYDLSDAFAKDIYIHLDEDHERFARNKRIVELAAKVDNAALLAAAERLSRLMDPVWARAAGATLRAAYADSRGKEILLDRSTPYGRILFGGVTHHWYRDLDAAFILDLGGDDFYTGNNGGSNGGKVPLSVCVDLEGNDAYESTLKGCQGAGILGVGLLLDLAGDDQYISQQWSQGCGYLGVGILRDVAGNDTYRGRSFCQGVGLFGAGLLLDDAGCDRYEGDSHVQGTGLAHGIGAVVDREGSDQYYAKGLYPTNYGDAGIFDSWSQGCGMGFRTIASGGLGLLVDGGGRDRMEAGNFSQGGGYYYGLGILRAAGNEDDIYIGSRYNQGFSAHEAVGAFLEDGGNDAYTTRQAVAQGLAWDECVTLFVDEGGNDCYDGGGGFSQGASAHNSFCFFVDRGGRDRYTFAPGQALAGGNDYHGGASLSLFLDEGGAQDTYTSTVSKNGALRFRPQNGLFLDLTGTAAKAARSEAWKGMPRIK